MSTKNHKGLLVSLGVVAIVAGVWYFTSHTKISYAKAIIKNNGTQGSLAVLLTFDEGYLHAWAKSLSKGRDTFTYNGKVYNTSGGIIIT